MAEWGAALTGAVAGGIAIVGKQSIEAYSEFEQLVGGVETLFGDSSDTVQEYASNAFRTAGLSANEYMETVTSFSASLLQSLDGDTTKAAEVADMAITDMADNANKMGTSIESIQNAYQGFAKQNYTMLDNLKLGYGGTKTEMERLLADAEKLSGQKYDISNLNDVYEAIHVVQTEMGITGTTAKEASETISGSISAAKSAWENLLTGLADDNANFEQLIGNFTESIVTVGDNIMPRIQTVMENIGVVIQEFIPIIMEALPPIISESLPTIIDAAMALVQGIVEALPEMIKLLVDQIPTIIDSIVNTIIELAPELITASIEIITNLATGILENVPTLVEAIPELIEAIIKAVVDALPLLVDAGKSILGALFKGIKSSWTAIADWVTEKIQWVADKFSGVTNTRADARNNSGGSHAAGLNYVPYDGYQATLHRGETVLNSSNTSELLNTISKLANNNSGNNKPIEVTLKLDSTVLARELFNANENEAIRRGTSLLGV